MRRIRRWLTAVAIGVALAVPATLPVATPAHAGTYDYVWRQSGCNPAVLIYGVPGRGSIYYTARYGYVQVYDDMYSIYANHGWECPGGDLRLPIKWSDGPHPMSEFSSSTWVSYGIWFQGGAIHRWAPFGLTAASLGNYGQCAGSCY